MTGPMFFALVGLALMAFGVGSSGWLDPSWSSWFKGVCSGIGVAMTVVGLTADNRR